MAHSNVMVVRCIGANTAKIAHAAGVMRCPRIDVEYIAVRGRALLMTVTES